MSRIYASQGRGERRIIQDEHELSRKEMYGIMYLWYITGACRLSSCRWAIRLNDPGEQWEERFLDAEKGLLEDRKIEEGVLCVRVR